MPAFDDVWIATPMGWCESALEIVWSARRRHDTLLTVGRELFAHTDHADSFRDSHDKWTSNV